ncbi:MAG TPA: hypothetical protein VIK33_10510 [Anaerolineae bacterium]
MAATKPVEPTEEKQRPYFIWNADLGEDDVRRILAEGSAYSRVQLMGTILQYARYKDIWKYVRIQDVQRWFWQIPWRSAEIRDYWKWALTLWEYPPDECADPVAARFSI